MPLLWLITVLWAFSFSLIGVFIAGHVDDYIAVATRMVLALLIFIPFFKPVSWWASIRLMAVGAIEIGIMYLFLYHSYQYLNVSEILLFTIFTPLYVSFFSDLLARQWPRQFWLPALLAVAGAAVIRWTELSDDYWLGFAFVQGANACFALGQVWYRRQTAYTELNHRQRFFWFFAGATIITVIAALALADWQQLPQTPVQIGVLLWLGLINSGLGYLGWSYGSTLVSTQQLAVMNNVLIPTGILINVVVWQGYVDISWWRLVLGTVFILLALWISRRGLPLATR